MLISTNRHKLIHIPDQYAAVPVVGNGDWIRLDACGNPSALENSFAHIIKLCIFLVFSFVFL